MRPTTNSATRLPRTRAAYVAQNETLSVTGTAWLDREWGSNQLADSVAGWDWLRCNLDDGRDLMVYRLRLTDGTTSPYSAGVLVEIEPGLSDFERI